MASNVRVLGGGGNYNYLRGGGGGDGTAPPRFSAGFTSEGKSEVELRKAQTEQAKANAYALREGTPQKQAEANLFQMRRAREEALIQTYRETGGVKLNALPHEMRQHIDKFKFSTMQAAALLNDRLVKKSNLEKFNALKTVTTERGIQSPDLPTEQPENTSNSFRDFASKKYFARIRAERTKFDGLSDAAKLMYRDSGDEGDPFDPTDIRGVQSPIHGIRGPVLTEPERQAIGMADERMADPKPGVSNELLALRTAYMAGALRRSYENEARVAKASEMTALVIKTFAEMFNAASQMAEQNKFMGEAPAGVQPGQQPQGQPQPSQPAKKPASKPQGSK